MILGFYSNVLLSRKSIGRDESLLGVSLSRGVLDLSLEEGSVHLVSTLVLGGLLLVNDEANSGSGSDTGNPEPGVALLRLLLSLLVIISLGIIGLGVVVLGSGVVGLGIVVLSSGVVGGEDGEVGLDAGADSHEGILSLLESSLSLGHVSVFGSGHNIEERSEFISSFLLSLRVSSELSLDFVLSHVNELGDLVAVASLDSLGEVLEGGESKLEVGFIVHELFVGSSGGEAEESNKGRKFHLNF
mmetsp:Transcript_1494/g.1982  ORF Transcript_1494/g.1982 Transcript_1494/m.1982 type:complete len:244 (-) Transcript_1494:31-762(-)